jgi:RNA 3'-phosphate cyclase
MGLDVRASVGRRGYYPRGGGEVVVEVSPGKPRPLVLEGPCGTWNIAGEAHVANLPIAIAERMRDAALSAAATPGSIRVRALGREEARGTGGAITVWAESDAGLVGASRVAERGVRAEALGEAVGHELSADMASGANLDAHAADQILVYLALAEGRSSFGVREVTSHARTTMELVSRFLPVRYELEAAGTLTRLIALPR